MKRPIFSLIPILLLAAVSLLFTGAAAAQEPIPPIPPEPPLPPPVWPAELLKIEYQRVDVRISGQVATTRIDQLFVNEGERVAEGSYLFPLPEGAAVSELTMWVDGQPIEARILEAPEARAIYDAIVRQLRDPALLEYVGSSAIQANVFPIPAGDERRVEIEYNHVLPADNGLIHYVFPQSTHLYSNLPLQSQSIRVELESEVAIRTLYSPSHDVAIVRDGDFRATIGYEGSNVTPDKDFDLYYSVLPEAIGLSLLSYQEAGEDGFFLILVAPTVVVDPDAVVARDVILVLDTSGSMAGEKMSQAKGAARYVIEHLNAEDRFNIVTFSTGVRSFAPAVVPASGSRADAIAFIDRLEALGGTNISMALLEALAQADADRPLTILFLTDGLATEGIVDTPRLLEAVDDAAPDSTRLFAFGVGHDVDTLLLGSLAQNHRGTTTYVRPGEPLDEVVSGFYAKMNTPVLADLELDVDGVRVEQIYPTTLPDLFAGTQLVLAGRYREGGPATITLGGDVNGQPQQFVYADVTFARQGGPAFIPRLWATRAIGHMLQQIRLHGEDSELVQSIVDLSIRYGIITPYTSYLIEEDDIFSQTARRTIVASELESAAGAAAPVSGEAAVDRADTAANLAAAEAPAAVEMPLSASSAGKPVVRSTGSKTFVLRSWEGVDTWIDTRFDADRHTPQPVAFASDAYFSLLDAAPELGQYLAVGSRLLVVHDDDAYLIGGEGESAPLPLPAATPGTVSTAPDSAAPEANSGWDRPGCGAALLPLLRVAGIAVMRRRSR
jgi:Ca-activated chloride channel homolog